MRRSGNMLKSIGLYIIISCNEYNISAYLISFSLMLYMHIVELCSMNAKRRSLRSRCRTLFIINHWSLRCRRCRDSVSTRGIKPEGRVELCTLFVLTLNVSSLLQLPFPSQFPLLRLRFQLKLNSVHISQFRGTTNITWHRKIRT